MDTPQEQHLLTTEPLDPLNILSTRDKHINIIDELISCCLSTSKAPLLIKHEKGGIIKVRGQLHLYMTQPFGTHKSYILRGIPPEMVFHMRKFTLPALSGTIDRNGNIVGSVLTRAAGKTLIIDEAHKLTESARDSLNELLEKQCDERSLGFAIDK